MDFSLAICSFFFSSLFCLVVFPCIGYILFPTHIRSDRYIIFDFRLLMAKAILCIQQHCGANPKEHLSIDAYKPIHLAL